MSERTLARHAKREGYTRTKFVRLRTAVYTATAERDGWTRRELRAALAELDAVTLGVWPQVTKVAAPHPLQAAFNAWVHEQTPLNALCETHNVVNSHAMRAAFVEIAGSREAYDKLKADGAGGGPFGGVRPTTRTERIAQQHDRDKDVRRVSSASSVKGWTHRWVFDSKVVTITTGGESKTMMGRELLYTVFISPKGNEYVYAQPTEDADLLYTGTMKKLGAPSPVRLRRVAHSAIVANYAKVVRRAAQLRAAPANAGE